MQPTSMTQPTLVPMPANDLPTPEVIERARHRTRERRLRGPTWSSPERDVNAA